MQDTDPLYQYVREVMVEVMAVLYTHGQKTLHVGAMMRLLGVEEETAALHDEDRIDIEENFEELAKSMHMKYLQSTVSVGATIH